MTHVSDTVPYAWPWDGAASPRFEPERLAVVVCGAQPHWIDMIGTDTDTGRSAYDRCFDIVEVVDELRAAGVLVAWIRTGRTIAGTRPIDRTLPAVRSADWTLVADLRPTDIVVDTPGHDGFAVAWLDAELRGRGIDRLVLVGVGTETVVSGTNRSANDRGYECLTLTDAVVHHRTDTGEAALSSICMSGGIFGAIGSSDALIDSLQAS